MDDTETLTELNLQFIEAFRQGSRELLQPILSPSFSYLDGATGEVWKHERYVENLRSHPSAALAIDQLVVHVDGDTAVVSARTSRQPGKFGRYVDTYQRAAMSGAVSMPAFGPSCRTIDRPGIATRPKVTRRATSPDVR